ncbi:hypothetical protein LBBP_01610 [Leptospira borgpetersenii serovar Ballum]|uniref:Uncharacterized protein n=1 Tax=Leptospira borgpetersenii serovar Ballum TaxID=280505 RepID=A0A0S2IQF7_LEPBO|nr:hypothetical protein LBBP_01610 [Leptospira borgpetersenii serovar Ballum]
MGEWEDSIVIGIWAATLNSKSYISVFIRLSFLHEFTLF